MENKIPVTTLHFRMHCDEVAQTANQYSGATYRPEKVQLSIVNGSKPEDQPFIQSSPGAEFKSMIMNEQAKGFFKPGKRYEFIVREVEEDHGV